MAKQSITFKIEGSTIPPGPVVFKILAGKKYFIWKAPGIYATLKSLQKDLSIKINNCKETDLFYDLVWHISRHRVYNLGIRILFSSENHAELMDFERQELKRCYNDNDCLNSLFEPYQPKWINSSENKAISATLPESKAIVPELPEKEITSEIKPQISNNSAKPVQPVKIPAAAEKIPADSEPGDDLESLKNLLAGLKE